MGTQPSKKVVPLKKRLADGKRVQSRDKSRRANDPLRPTAERLRPLVRERLEWWRETVRRWANNPPLYVDYDGLIVGESRAKEEGLGDDDVLDEGVLPVPFPDTPLSVDERIALLAAIHDAVPGAAENVNPWQEAKSKKDRAKGTPYFVLLGDRIPKLRRRWKTHGAEVAEWVADLERRTPAPLANDSRQAGRTVTKAALEVRKLLAERWERFSQDYGTLGYKRASYENFAEWTTEEFDDMPSDKSDVLRRIMAAHRKTPAPKRVK